jgi:hypothetical protein
MKTLEEWLRNNFYLWFSFATILDLLLLSYIAWRSRCH